MRTATLKQPSPVEFFVRVIVIGSSTIFSITITSTSTSTIIVLAKKKRNAYARAFTRKALTILRSFRLRLSRRVKKMEKIEQFLDRTIGEIQEQG
jgi:hypothetical protein